jgi:hypothetical protein
VEPEEEEIMATVMDRPTTAVSAYPIDVQADFPSNPGRLYAVPILGFVIRYILLIPHLIMLGILMYAVMAVQLFAWIPVLFGGSYNQGLYNFTSGFLRWYLNVIGYMLGLTDAYPPFGFSEQPGSPIRVTFNRPEQSNRLFAVPVIGILIREVLLIPHLIAVYVLAIVCGVISLVAWIPVLFSGSYPTWAYKLFTGYMRWASRVFGYLLGLTDVYPPFSLGN